MHCWYPGMRKALVLVCALAVAVPAAALASSPARSRAHAASVAALHAAVARDIHAAGPLSGTYVIDATAGRALYGSRATQRRILASNTKLWTSGAALARYGPKSALATAVLGTGTLAQNGVFSGNLFLRGGGDPTFGSRAFAERNYGSDASVEALASDLRNAGVKQVSGAVIGDESLFDSRRGGPSSGYSASYYVGPLSALDYNRGLANSAGTAFQSNPPLFAAPALEAALRHAGIRVTHNPGTGHTPPGAYELAEVRSPNVGRLIQLMDKTSDNYFAEMLVKGLAVAARPGGSLRRPTDGFPAPPTAGGGPGTDVPPPLGQTGTTASGAGVAMTYAHSLGLHPQLVDGSGLSTGDRATPRDVATLLLRMRSLPSFSFFYAALSIAGRDGTLVDRMRSGPAHNNCHGKTGTLTGVSALSGYCRARNGHAMVFSALMNGVGDLARAHALQDAIAQAVAGFR